MIEATAKLAELIKNAKADQALAASASGLGRVAQRFAGPAARISAILEAGPGGEAGRKEGEKWAIAGMATLLTGNKPAALTMFARGVALLERSWRERHPEFQGGLKERVAESVRFYEETHRHPTNRLLHQVGIPMIVGGAAGLILAPAYRPLWLASAGSFALGWGLNILGHARFEKNRPAFSADPLSFMTGPLWDVKQLFAKKSAAAAA